MDLRKFIALLDSTDDLHHFRTPVAPDLELAGLCRREFSKKKGAALLFEQLNGYRFRAAANLFGAETRMAKILRCEGLRQFAVQLRKNFQTQQGTAYERLKKLAECKSGMKTTRRPLWQRIPGASLLDLPAIKSWPKENRPYLTLPLVISRHPLTGAQNLGMYRVQIQGEKLAAVNFQPGSGAGKHLEAAGQLGEPLPVALVFGSDPALSWLAAAPLPSGLNDFGLFQYLFAEELRLAEGCTQPLQVPADAEFVVEGFIASGRTCQEGPFGNHTGSYVSRVDCPVMEITSIAWREQAIMPFTVVGPPPSENVFLGRANEVLIREILRIDYPEITALRMPEQTIFHGVTLLQVAGGGSKSMADLLARLWENSPLQIARLLILIDGDIDPEDYEKVFWRLVNQLDGHRIHRQGKKLAIDATGVDPELLLVENRDTAERLKRLSKDDED